MFRFDKDEDGRLTADDVRKVELDSLSGLCVEINGSCDLRLCKNINSRF